MVFLAGFVDAIAGGGGLISLPAYLFAGLPTGAAIATNKMSSAIGTSVSTYRYCRRGYADVKLAIPGIITSLLGAQLGARLAMMVDDRYFKIIMLIMLPFIAFAVLKKKEFKNEDVEISRKKQYIIVTIASLLIGVYDGFYGPGTGTFLILVYTGLAKMNVLTASANTKIANLTSNISSLVVFLMNGAVVIPLGLAAAVFSIAGHYTGASLAMKKGMGIIRGIVLLVIALLFAKIIYEFIA